ncbi:AcrR family transcriptional regulator [Cryobacterium mesophilum]|uniref:TetR/AcrR family transcriptional regulator n=1 Tax=Terrimesophilobacter mesophilus TaxID=433647 RepID=A0A4R8VDF2_9MICO|nr:TetR/AcrR family transcriptional regulator [Terrimesophilobacter mesophilus]MBB5634035.1 AcrR family transcriptional regulator [Terrimesophilobacter mesophilus]TFB81384.1 TetR/AcrR family transcriptional regulator [Terrimesophilobacter mesophilus]
MTDIAATIRQNHDQESILRGAAEVFIQHGYDATSMGVLAENLGITKSAIYHHVPSKEYLLQLALDRALDSLEAILVDPLASTGSAIDRLMYVLRSSVGVLTDQLPFVTLLLRLRGNTELERSALTRRRAFNQVIAELVDQARTDGDIRSDIDPRTTTRLLFGMIGSVVDWYRPGGPVSAEDVANDVVAVAFGGVRAR